MTTITEGALAFDFPRAWVASKYDAWNYYVNHFQKVCGSAKAVDIVAIHANQRIWLIEIKNYRAGPRQKLLELAEEIPIQRLPISPTAIGLVGTFERSDFHELRQPRTSRLHGRLQ